MQQKVLYLEEFDPQTDTDFLENEARPYFQSIFKDIAIRRHTPKRSDSEVAAIDHVAFNEFSNLPGLINDRFFACFQKVDNKIQEDSFVDIFLMVFLSPLDDKMRLTFNM